MEGRPAPAVEPASAPAPAADASPAAGAPDVLCVILGFAGRAPGDVVAALPPPLLADPAWSFVYVAAAGDESAAGLAEREGAQRGVRRWTVLRSPPRIGRGGMQKIAFQAAIEAGARHVVVLPGDGQYPAGEVVRLVETARREDADVVLAVRVGAEGGVPAHLRLLNRTVSRVQSVLAGRRLSEFHSPFRAFATSFLRASRFDVASNDDRFDTEILLQAVHAAARIREVAVEVDYAKRLRETGRWRYARLALGAALRFRLHRWGTFCSLQYRGLRPLLYRDKGDALYSSHAAALAVVRRLAPDRAVDLGCGPGFVAERCEQMGVRVTGVDALPPLPGKMTDFRRVHLDREELGFDPFEFPVVLFLDVVEHLSDPEGFLVRIRNRSRALDPSRTPPVLVLTTPNVAFFGVRASLLLGRFNYAERGILDIDHRRLFTRASLLRLLEDSGYDVLSIRPVAAPFEAVLKGRAGRWMGRLSQLLARAWPGMFAFQFLVEATPRPGLETILRRARGESAERA